MTGMWLVRESGIVVWVGFREGLEREAGVVSSQKEARVYGGRVRRVSVDFLSLKTISWLCLWENYLTDPETKSTCCGTSRWNAEPF